ncbi:hypothetical protein LUZ60_002515 [Juncus effusus]|nr:hypothetical protein LUZ60_002515 [Juncus effusus]
MEIISSPSFSSPFIPRLFARSRVQIREFKCPNKKTIQCCFGTEECESNSRKGITGRRVIFSIPIISLGLFAPYLSYAKSKSKSIYDERRLLEQNKKIQQANNAPDDFPSFIREGFEVKVLIPESFKKSESGLLYRDVEIGTGDCPKDGQQVVFHYIGYNESGRRIDSTYFQGAPAKIRLGNNALVPGFEEGIKAMKPGGKRRIIIPPELGPPVGPSTFFSAKQYEVFDVELLKVQDCQRRTIGFYSDVVCN